MLASTCAEQDGERSRKCFLQHVFKGYFYTEQLFGGGRKGISVKNCGAQERKRKARRPLYFSLGAEQLPVVNAGWLSFFRDQKKVQLIREALFCFNASFAIRTLDFWFSSWIDTSAIFFFL